MIWYGDEAGMWGADDPVSRKPMLWGDLGAYENAEDRVDEAHLTAYRAIFALRAQHAALRRGTFRALLVDDAKDVWVFERALGDERMVVLLSASGQEQSVVVLELREEGWNWRVGFDSECLREARMGDRLPPRSGRVLIGTRSPRVP